MQIILNGPRNFIVGALLYKKLGTNLALKDLLAKGETPFAKKQLVEELTKLSNGLPPAPCLLLDKETVEMPAGDDEVLTAILNEWMPLY